MSELISNLNTIESCKLDIKSAIEAKGVSMSGVSFPDYASAIGSITTSFVTTTLSTSVNGTFIPTAGVDGYSQVVVNVPQTGYSTNNIVMGYLESNISTIYDSTITYVTNGGLTGVKYYMNPLKYSNDNYVKRHSAWLLTQIDLPNVSVVGWFGFFSQTKLKSVYLSSCLYIGNQAFEGCTALTTVSLPMCKEIQTWAFSYCTSLSELVLPNCMALFSSVFAYCQNLTKLTLGYSSVCSINAYTFYYSPIASGTCSVYVPTSLVDAYKSANYWSSYSNQIFPIPEP